MTTASIILTNVLYAQYIWLQDMDSQEIKDLQLGF